MRIPLRIMRSPKAHLIRIFVLVALAVFFLRRTLTLENPGFSRYALTIFLCFAALFFLIDACIRFAMKRRVQKLYKELCAYYSSAPEFRITSVEKAQAADYPYYSDITNSLQSHGYVFAADVENLTNSRIYPDYATCDRLLRAGDGTSYVAAFSVRSPFHPRVARHLRPWLHCCSLCTRFTNDTFLTTKFFDGLPQFPCPNHFLETLQWEAGIDALIARHSQRMVEHLTANPAERVVTTVSTREILDAIMKSHEIVNKNRTERGFLSPQEFRTMLEKLGGKPNQVNWLVDALESILAEKQLQSLRSLKKHPEN